MVLIVSRVGGAFNGRTQHSGLLSPQCVFHIHTMPNNALSRIWETPSRAAIIFLTISSASTIVAFLPTHRILVSIAALISGASIAALLYPLARKLRHPSLSLPVWAALSTVVTLVFTFGVYALVMWVGLPPQVTAIAFFTVASLAAVLAPPSSEETAPSGGASSQDFTSSALEAAGLSYLPQLLSRKATRNE